MAFFVDRRAQAVSQGTITFYQKKLKRFITFCESRAVTQIPELTPNDIRLYLLQLQEEGHNPGGVHAYYRALRAFLLWYEDEFEPENWKNPIRKVKAPRVPIEPLDPVELSTVKKLRIISKNRGKQKEAEAF
ncbi:MAG: phage integrase N-terminal SAM-like domain-containing protein [Anaerolineaceae bacterium]|nr:phage integrase N-terminal SAM-like domain-containing protein [Anaerolineaceae bacterium]